MRRVGGGRAAALSARSCAEAGTRAGGSNGALIYVDPATGAFQGQTNIGAGVSLRPIVANSTLYILDDRGRLTAFR